jgi:hypothetical protein
MPFLFDAFHQCLTCWVFRKDQDALMRFLRVVEIAGFAVNRELAFLRSDQERRYKITILANLILTL